MTWPETGLTQNHTAWWMYEAPEGDETRPYKNHAALFDTRSLRKGAERGVAKKHTALFDSGQLPKG